MFALPLQNISVPAKSNIMKRELDIVILSDIHLGTYGCHAKELLNYLKDIQPKILVLNGDIFDIWYFKIELRVTLKFIIFVSNELPKKYTCTFLEI